MAARVAWVLFGLALGQGPAWAQKQVMGVEAQWFPVSDAERQQAAPAVEKNAGVEAVFWREHVWDEATGEDWQRKRVVYVRLKIFTEEGRRVVSSIELPFGKDVYIESVEGRTHQPDGSVVPLRKQDVREREVLRVGGERWKAKSFSLPAARPGSIVEYKFRETRFKADIRYFRASLQHEFPVRLAAYFFRPMDSLRTEFQLRVWPFQCDPTPVRLEGNGFLSTMLRNVPAFREEPYMAGEWNVRPWVLFLYLERDRLNPAGYWEKTGRESYHQLKQALKVDGEVRRAAAAAVAGAKTDLEKALALITFLRKEVRSFSDPRTSDSERAQASRSWPKNRDRTSAEVFKSQLATADELNTLFAAMAQAVGMEARPVFVASRDGVLFDPKLIDREYFLPNVDMAVKLGDSWKMFDVSARHLYPEMIGWREEGLRALLTDPERPEFIHTPLSPPEASRTRRIAKMNLLDDGTLEGDVTVDFTGHTAATRRAELDGLSAEARREALREQLLGQYPGAEVSEIQIENLEDTRQPVLERYRLRIPKYGQRTGRRLLFAPLLFQQGKPPVFTASERRHDIHFPFAFQEEDGVTIQLPAGFVLDNAARPGGVDFGGPGSLQYAMRLNGDGSLTAGRKLTFGADGAITFSAGGYPQLKQIFDEIHKRDGVVLALRQESERQ